jgi:hypothetical protein
LRVNNARTSLIDSDDIIAKHAGDTGFQPNYLAGDRQILMLDTFFRGI